MTLLIASWLALTAVPQDAPLPRRMALDEIRAQDPAPQDRPVEPFRPAREERPFVDLDWLELTPGIGMAVFSPNFRADPAPCLSIRAHAPMPWLNPASDPIGEHFGLFAQAQFATIARNLSPTVQHRRGVATFLSIGADYSFVRDGTWIMLARAGVMYAHYGGIADLRNGFGPLVGATAGLQLSGKLALTYSPELIFGDSGSLVFLNTLGLVIQF